MHLPVLIVVKHSIKADWLPVLIGNDQLCHCRGHALLEDVAWSKVIAEEAQVELGLVAGAIQGQHIRGTIDDLQVQEVSLSKLYVHRAGDMPHRRVLGYKAHKCMLQHATMPGHRPHTYAVNEGPNMHA